MTPTITSPESGRSALLTIDMQRDFALPSSLAHIPGTLEAAGRIETLVQAFRSAHRPIVHMLRLYLPDGSNADLPRRAYLEAGSTSRRTAGSSSAASAASWTTSGGSPGSGID